MSSAMETSIAKVMSEASCLACMRRTFLSKGVKRGEFSLMVTVMSGARVSLLVEGEDET